MNRTYSYLGDLRLPKTLLRISQSQALWIEEFTISGQQLYLILDPENFHQKLREGAVHIKPLSNSHSKVGIGLAICRPIIKLKAIPANVINVYHICVFLPKEFGWDKVVRTLHLLSLYKEKGIIILSTERKSIPPKYGCL